MMVRRNICVLLLLLSIAVVGSADEVTLEQIMADPDWIGNSPEDPFWGDDGSIYYEQKRLGEKIRDLFEIARGSSEARQVETDEMSTFSRPERRYSQDRSSVVWVHAGDLFVKELRSGAVRQLTRTADVESDPVFLIGGEALAFQRNGSYFTFDFASGLVSQLADLQFADDPAEPEEKFDYLASKHERLYRKVAEAKRDEEAETEHSRDMQGGDPARPPLTWYLGQGPESVFESLSPTGDHLLVVTRPEDFDRGRRGEMPNYVTTSGFVETREVRTRVNRNEPAGSGLILLDLETRQRHDIDLKTLPGIQEDPLAALRPEAIEWHVEHGADKEQVEKALEAPETRPVRIIGVEWSDDGRNLAVQVRSMDNKDRWIATVGLSDGTLVTQHRLTDPAWINWRYNEYGWLPDNRTLWYLSEESGYSHLYTRTVGSEPRQLTSGEHVVWEPVLTPDGDAFVYRANVEHPGVYEIYRVAATGGEPGQLTALGGMNDFRLSPDGSELLVIHSEIDHRPDLWLQRAEPGAAARRLTDSVSDEFAAIDWVIPEIVEVSSSHVDRPIYSKLYLPADFEPSKRYPAVVFVHGAGYLQNSHKGWAGYFREFMFHTILVRNGYIVLDMDYRASAGYGRDWRTAIYRQMGHPELEDLQDGVAWLVREQSVDAARVGVYGGSYGGFMTFMSLFRDPDLFAAGAALRPVTDWAHYNHGYTSNILNTPEVDPVAYERSSPIEYAQNLERPLLMASGMQDNNVFFQDTVLLIQRLIELKKENFEIAIYPLDPHTFVHAESWLDEYRRIFKLFERWVR